MNEFINGPLGALHTLSATIALIVGLIVLLSKKGTGEHKKLGYIYVLSMLILNISAIPITNMSGSIGLFHVFILISLPTIITAIYIPLFMRNKPNWVSMHFSFMYWSYVGLVAAFINEVMVRLPAIIFVADKINNQITEQTVNIAAILAFTTTGIVIFFSETIFRSWRKKFTENIQES